MGIQLSGLSSGMDTESIVTQLMSAQRLKSTKVENKKTMLEWKQDIWKSLNAKIYSFYTGPLAKLKMQGSFQTKLASSTNEDKVTVTAGSSAPTGTHSIQVSKVASSQFVTGSKIASDVTGSTKLSELGFDTTEGTVISVQAGTKSAVTLDVDADATVDDFVSTCRDAGLSCQFDTTQDRFYISSKESGYANAFSITSSGSTTNSLNSLGLSEIVTTTDADGVATTAVDSNYVKLVNSSDASILYNGAEITSSSNTITANGLTFTVKGVTDFAGVNGATADEVINISVTNDTTSVYNMIKDFVKSYNELLQDLNDDYYADTAKGYDPLTDDQKEAMTDDQITQWEDKIKSSLLRRDSSVATVVNAMRSSFNANVKVDGKVYDLSSFGIVTTDYTENGKLHIYGDSDDSTVAGTTDKLQTALQDNPEAVMEVFNTLANNLYKTMTEKMSRTELNSALTFYNDKEMKRTMDNYNDQLDILETRFDEMQTRYYKQFTAMETAMSKLNSQSSSLASMLGTSS